MSEFHAADRLSRRALLSKWAAAAALPALAPLAAGGQVKTVPKPYPFKLGLQSYSLRNFPLDDALAKTKTLGLTWWEGYPGHLPMTDDAAKIASYRQSLQSHGVRMISYGVVDFSNDEADARKKFEFAKAMGIGTLTAAPKPDALPLLDKLTQEYAINIGIHNHGPDDHQWGDWQQILDAVSGLNPRVGACDDTGHYLRAGKNPITAVTKFGPRLHSIHLKSVAKGPNGTEKFVPIGTTGALMDVVQLLRFLKEQKYMGIIAIEEEEQPDNPMPLISRSIEATRRYIHTVNTVTLKSE
jgi:sugar phosphate isomerase/epimerase